MSFTKISPSATQSLTEANPVSDAWISSTGNKLASISTDSTVARNRELIFSLIFFFMLFSFPFRFFVAAVFFSFLLQSYCNHI